ncbi:MAG: hypothetical protein WCI84_02370 [Bacteroidota bacterium]
MKTRIALVAVIVMMAIQFTASQGTAKRFDTEEKKIIFATKNLLNAFRTANTGVIESALRITAQMKMRYPAADVSELTTVMSKVWQNHPSGTTRYKAYLAISVCENPEWYSNEKNLLTANEENFFHAASARMQEQLLSANEE